GTSWPVALEPALASGGAVMHDEPMHRRFDPVEYGTAPHELGHHHGGRSHDRHHDLELVGAPRSRELVGASPIGD
ncbi:MAG: hypothetical protein IT336_13460, partial [Thermomicrobiales bacterium]|nr:hypothetical protein [Thermomicrobiales bacterium]